MSNKIIRLTTQPGKIDYYPVKKDNNEEEEEEFIRKEEGLNKRIRYDYDISTEEEVEDERFPQIEVQKMTFNISLKELRKCVYLYNVRDGKGFFNIESEDEFLQRAVEDCHGFLTVILEANSKLAERILGFVERQGICLGDWGLGCVLSKIVELESTLVERVLKCFEGAYKKGKFQIRVMDWESGHGGKVSGKVYFNEVIVSCLKVKPDVDCLRCVLNAIGAEWVQLKQQCGWANVQGLFEKPLEQAEEVINSLFHNIVEKKDVKLGKEFLEFIRQLNLNESIFKGVFKFSSRYEKVLAEMFGEPVEEKDEDVITEKIVSDNEEDVITEEDE